MALVLKGGPVATRLNEKMADKIKELEANGIFPTLAIVRVGERGDDIAYERTAINRCAKVGMQAKQVLLPADVSQEDLLAAIEELNNDDKVHGVLIFRPLPKHIDDEAVRAALNPAKDIDGITEGSLAGVFTGSKVGFAPCTAEACMEILDYYGIDPKGKRAVVIGRSLVIGKPVAMMLMAKNATITMCHTRTVDLPAEARRAEILIAAAGQAGTVGKECVSEDQVVIDVGVNVDAEGNLCGDVLFDEVEGIVGSVTPVPGGVGTVTTSLLLMHVVQAAEKLVK